MGKPPMQNKQNLMLGNIFCSTVSVLPVQMWWDGAWLHLLNQSKNHFVNPRSLLPKKSMHVKNWTLHWELKRHQLLPKRSVRYVTLPMFSSGGILRPNSLNIHLPIRNYYQSPSPMTSVNHKMCQEEKWFARSQKILPIA